MWLSRLLVFMTRVLVGAHASGYELSAAPARQRIYFANHSSHIDTLALWSALPESLRRRTRPVAARDYWGRGRLRPWLALKGLNAVLIERVRKEDSDDPLTPLAVALNEGDSLILFPEGTRRDEALPGEFRSGIYRLAQRYPEVELLPVYLENLHRVMPKGALLPVPLYCAVRFGAPLVRIGNESKENFLLRARQAVIELAGVPAT